MLPRAGIARTPPTALAQRRRRCSQRRRRTSSRRGTISSTTGSIRPAAGSPAGESRWTLGPKAGSSAGTAGAHRRGHGPLRQHPAPQLRHDTDPTAVGGNSVDRDLPNPRRRDDADRAARRRLRRHDPRIARSTTGRPTRRAGPPRRGPTGHAPGPRPQPRTTQRSGHRDRHRHLRTPPRTVIHRWPKTGIRHRRPRP